MTPNLNPKLIVVGAGYAGVLAANRLARKTRESVLLVSESTDLVHRVRLHETAARGTSSLHALAGLLHPRVQLLHAKAVGLDPAACHLRVRDASGTQTLAYRTLVLALGSHLHAAIETSAPHALALASHDRALAFHDALQAAPDDAWVTIVGGGLTAVELATEIAEAHPRLRVRMLCDVLVADLPTAPRNVLLRALRRLRIELVEGVMVQAIDEERVHTEHQVFESQLTTLAAGFRASVPAWLSALPRTPDGRLAVDAALRVLGHTNLYAVGDVASPPASSIGSGEKTTRMGCVNAMPLAAHASDVIAGEEPVPFHFNYPGRSISLGRRSALVVFTDRDDRPTGRFLEGRVAALLKDLICRFVLVSLRFEAREWVGYAWLGMNTRAQRPALPAPQ
jgi:NADH dehydrogenase